MERRKGARGKERQKIFLDFVREVAAVALAKLWEEVRHDDQVSKAAEKREQNLRALSDEYLLYLGALFDPNRFGNELIPF